MITHSGQEVWPDNDGVPTLQDIGRGLGRTARFAGQTREYYTVRYPDDLRSGSNYAQAVESAIAKVPA